MYLKSSVFILRTLGKSPVVKKCLVQRIIFWFTQHSVDNRGRISLVFKGGKTQINFSQQSMKVGLPLSSALDSREGNGFRIGSGASRASHRREEGGEIRNRLRSELPRVAQGSP